MCRLFLKQIRNSRTKIERRPNGPLNWLPAKQQTKRSPVRLKIEDTNIGDDYYGITPPGAKLPIPADQFYIYKRAEPYTYEGEYELPRGAKCLEIWMQDNFSRRATFTYPVSIPGLTVQVYREEGEAVREPQLDLLCVPDILTIRGARLVDEAKFKIVTNYYQFIRKWRLIIYEPEKKGARLPDTERSLSRQRRGTPNRFVPPSAGLTTSTEPNPTHEATTNTEQLTTNFVSADAEETPKGYTVFYEREGTNAEIGKEIVWDGLSTDGRRLVEADKAYRYKLFVESPEGLVDVTREGQFIVVSRWSEPLAKILNIKPPVEKKVEKKQLKKKMKLRLMIKVVKF